MRSLFKLLARVARCTSGGALVEMTIILPVTIALMAGGVDFGMAFATLATGNKSAHNAARYLGTLPPSAVCGWGQTNAINLAVYGNLAGTGNPLIKGWGPTGNNWGGANNNVTITTLPAVNCAVGYTTINVSAAFPFDSFIVASFLPISSTRTMHAQHEEPSIGQ